jgi:ribonuclease D
MTLITTNSALRDYCNSLKSAPFVTVDTEFLREKTYYAKLCLIQISGPDKNAAAIDVLANEEDLDLAPLWDILNDPSILKVFHAARQDLEIILQLSGKIPAPLFDSQVAAMVCGYGDQVGYEALVFDITKEKVDKTSQFTDWSRRPLSSKQILYALGDVIHLVDVYLSLKNRLEKQGRLDWVREEMDFLTDPATYDIKPEEIWRRFKLRSAKPKDLAVLRELAAWREYDARRRDVPRGRILKDETLLDLAYQKPQTEGDLARIRGVSADMARGKIGSALLDAISRGLAVPEHECPSFEKKEALSPRFAPIVEMLKMLLRISAAENHVAARLIATPDDLESFAQTPEGKSPLGHGWRYDVFGKDAKEMMEGRLALSLRKGKIHMTRIQE